MRGVAELQVLLRVSNDRALSRLTSRIIREFSLRLGEGDSHSHWKDAGLRDVRFPILLEEGTQPGEMLCQTLAAAWEVASPWTVLSVGEPFTAGWEFVAIADQQNADLRITGVEWMRISLLLDSSQTGE